MSKFGYNAEGELNSQYLLDLLTEYLNKLLITNDTKGIVENDLDVNVNTSKISQIFKDKINRIKIYFRDKNSSIENYNKVISTKYINNLLDKIKIFLKTNVLDPKEFFHIMQILKAINFDKLIPEIEENRAKVIQKSEKEFLKILPSIKYLQHINSEYILFNTPVDDLKPFLSEKVTKHVVDFKAIQILIKRFVELRHDEFSYFNFEPYMPEFKAKIQDFYQDKITVNGIGEEVEKFIRDKMIEKSKINSKDEVLKEEKEKSINEIDLLLKQVKLAKIEKLMQKLAVLKCNQAHVKEVIDNCKDSINKSTLTNKENVFLVMDALYYKLSKKCEKLQQKIKLKLELVDKQKLFDILQNLGKEEQNQINKEDKAKSNNLDYQGLYDEDESSEILIEYGEGDDRAEEEVVIEPEDNKE